METVSLVVGQVPFVVVQINLKVPATRPFTCEVGFEGEATVAAPESTVHTPLPLVTGVAARFVVEDEAQITWSGPALAGVGCASTFTTI